MSLPSGAMHSNHNSRLLEKFTEYNVTPIDICLFRGEPLTCWKRLFVYYPMMFVLFSAGSCEKTFDEGGEDEYRQRPSAQQHLGS